MKTKITAEQRAEVCSLYRRHVRANFIRLDEIARQVGLSVYAVELILDAEGLRPR